MYLWEMHEMYTFSVRYRKISCKVTVYIRILLVNDFDLNDPCGSPLLWLMRAGNGQMPREARSPVTFGFTSHKLVCGDNTSITHEMNWSWMVVPDFVTCYM